MRHEFECSKLLKSQSYFAKLLSQIEHFVTNRYSANYFFDQHVARDTRSLYVSFGGNASEPPPVSDEHSFGREHSASVRRSSRPHRAQAVHRALDRHCRPTPHRIRGAISAPFCCTVVQRRRRLQQTPLHSRHADELESNAPLLRARVRRRRRPHWRTRLVVCALVCGRRSCRDPLAKRLRVERRAER